MPKRLFVAGLLVLGLVLSLRAAEGNPSELAPAEEELTALLEGGRAMPRALAAADLDDDGAIDLVASYASPSGGIVTVRRGNPDAFAPTDDAVFVRLQAGYDPPSLSAEARPFAVPEPADLLQLGDFDGDLRKDVLVAARGGGLFLLPGDGRGGLGEARRIALEGTVTALAAGEFRAMDGKADAAVGVSGSAGAKLLLFDGAAGGLGGRPLEMALPDEATEIRFGMLDDDPFVDLAVAAGRQARIVHGWSREENVAPSSRSESIAMASRVRGLDVGTFVWSRAGGDQLALLLESGTVQIVHRGRLDETPWSEQELASRSRGAAAPVGKPVARIEALRGWTPEDATGWTVARELRSRTRVAAQGATTFRRAHLSPFETDDLLVGSQEESGLEVWRQPAESALPGGRGEELAWKSLDAGSVVDVLPLPQKLNGHRDLLVLSAVSAEPRTIAFAPTATINVDRTDDPSGASLPAVSACTVALNDCSVRGAVQFANANPGTVINIPAGTYTLATNGASSSGCDGNATGDLALNQATTITGAGAATTILRQHGTGPASNGDRVMCMNEGFLLNLVYGFSGLTITGGRDGSPVAGGLGGGGIIGGEKGNALTLTSVTLSNNQSLTVGGANLGGGGIQITGGNFTVTNCLIGGTSSPGLSTDRDTVANANSGASSGGGLYFTPSAPMHTASTGILTVTGTTFQRNTSSGIGGGGANLETFAFAAPGGIGSGSASFGTSQFLNNQAANGAGLDVASLATTVATSSFTSNAATNRGGGIYVGGASLALDGVSGAVTMTGNTAPNGGSSISTAAIVNVSGNGVTLGGDIEATTGGNWTNGAGITLAPTNIVVAGGTFNCSSSTMNVAGNISIGSGAVVGGTFNGNSGTVNIQGNVNVNLTNGGAFNGGTSTFNFNGSGAQAVNGPSSPTFNHLIVNKGGGTLTLNTSALLTGSLSVSAGTMDLGANTANRTALGGTLTVGNGTTLRIGGTGTLPSNYSAHSIGATSTIEYNGTSQAVATLNSAQSYGNLTTSGSGAKTLAGAIGVAGNVTLNGGTLDASLNNYAVNVLGNWTNNGGAFAGRGGTVTFSNTGNAQSIGGTAASQAFNNVTVSKTGQTLLVGGSTTTLGLGTLTLTGGIFNAGTATGINVGGDWINNGGSFTPGSSLVTFNNTVGAQTLGGTAAAQTFNGIAVAKTAQTLAVGGSTTALTLSGGLTLTSGTFSAGTASGINVAGNWTNNGGTFTPGTGLVTFNGSGAQSLGGTAAAQTFNNLTVNKGGASTLSIAGSTATLNLNAVTLTQGTLAAGTATAINVSGDWTNNGATFTPASSTVNFNSTTAAQTIGGTAAAQVFNGMGVAKAPQTLSVGGSTSSLTLNGGMTLTSGTLAAGTATGIAVAGNWTNNGGTFTPGSGLVTFNGAGAQAIGGTAATQTFNNLGLIKGAATLSAAGSTTTLNLRSLTLTSGTLSAGTANAINLIGDWTNNGGTFTGGAGTVAFNGSGAQSLGGSTATTFNGLTLNNAAGASLARDETVGGPLTLTAGALGVGANALTLSGNVTATAGSLTSGATGKVLYNQLSNGQPVLAASYGNLTFSDFTKTLPSSGTVRIAGTFVAGPTGGHTVTGSGLEFNGTAPQTMPAGFASYNNLTINNATGVLLGGNVTANGILTLSSGDLDTGPAFTLTMPATASSAGTTDVLGNVKRTGFVSGGSALSFGNPFTTIQIAAGTAPADVNVNLVKAVPAGFPAAVQRTYTVTPNGGSGISARIRLHYRDTELNGNAEGPGLHLFRFDGTAWRREDQQAGDATDNWAERSGVTSFSPWTLNSTETNPQEASPAASLMLATKGLGTSVNLTFTPACGATDHAVYWGTGPISGSLVWTSAACGLGVAGSATFDPGAPPPDGLLYWVIVGQTGLREGSYGQSTVSVERPEAVGVGACNRPQVLSSSCP